MMPLSDFYQTWQKHPSLCLEYTCQSLFTFNEGGGNGWTLSMQLLQIVQALWWQVCQWFCFSLNRLQIFKWLGSLLLSPEPSSSSKSSQLGLWLIASVECKRGSQLQLYYYIVSTTWPSLEIPTLPVLSTIRL